MPTFHLTYTDNAPNDYSIDQGADYSKVAFRYPGDVSAWTPRGSIRYVWLDLDPTAEPLAVFSFQSLAYDSVTNKTLIQPILTGSQTALMSHTKDRVNSNSSINLGVNVYVYDIDLISPLGAIVRLSSGYVEVNPEVTQLN